MILFPGELLIIFIFIIFALCIALVAGIARFGRWCRS